MTRTDEDLIHAVQGGDLDSLGVLVGRWEQPLFRFAFRQLRTREDASDVCQETFLRVLNNAERFRDGARVSTWLYQITLNLCRDQARKKRRWNVILDERRDARTAGSEAMATDAVDPSIGLEQDERRRAVVAALAQIPPEQREVLILKEFEGLKFREIAELLRCPESTVKSRMYYGLAGLKDALSRNGVHGF